MLRWSIAILISLAIAISYLDRQTVSVAIKAIGQDIPISNERFADLQSAFLLAYACMYLGGGKLVDALGTRRGFTLTMIFWSLACASHGLAATFAMLAVSRFLLGLGEGGAFPAATRAVAEWFPVKDRSLAMGIMNGGTAVGAVAAPPLVTVILLYFNWRWVFFITGSLGLIWTFCWRRMYYPPETHPGLGDAERAELASMIESRRGEKPPPLPWLDLLRYRQVYGLVFAKFLTDAAWYFYLFWLPKYLYDARGFDIKAVGSFAWIPYAFAGVGCLLGGWFSGWLVQRKYSLNAARKLALGLSAAVMPFILFVTHVPIGWALGLFSLAYFGQQSWSTLIMILPADIFAENVVGAVAGMVGFGGAMGGIVFGKLVGYLLDHGSGYGPVFAMAGTFHVIAFFIVLIAVPVIRPLHLGREPLREGVA